MKKKEDNIPIYEYKCNECGKRFTKLLKMPMSTQQERDQEYMRCPECQNIGVKIPSINHFILKGVGWSKDGYWKKKEEK